MDRESPALDALEPERLRTRLAGLDARQQKIVAGLLGALIEQPARVREREWVHEQLTRMTLLAGDVDGDSPQTAVHAVRAYLHTCAEELVSAAVLLFQRVGLDLAQEVPAGFTLEDALRRGLEYLPPPGAPEDAGGRDLGEQPLARRMAARGLRPRDLVAASEEQLTHKMVTRAMKGRRLTANTMGKVRRAWNRATGSAHAASELFDYEP